MWSDGDDFPENVAKWYKDNGYNFLAFSDHNTLLKGERWRDFPTQHQAVVRYRNQFGDDWVQTRPGKKAGQLQVRLRSLDEFRHKLEQPQKFLLIMGNEISNPQSVHLLGIHHDTWIPPAKTQEKREIMIQDIVNKVDAYREESGRNTYAIQAHPNWQWAITAEMMLAVENLRFFEVYNGHPGVNNAGDAWCASTDRMWDIVLAFRLSQPNGKLLYGVATDDAHSYYGGRAGPGRGWIMVRSAMLTPEALFDAMDKGDFYATTGVTLRDIHLQGDIVHVEIEPKEGEEYVTEYVGTRRGFDQTSKPTVNVKGNEIANTTSTYSEQIGEVLLRTADTKSFCKISNDELYVRVRVTSTAIQKDPITGRSLGAKQRAWSQPMVVSH